MVELEGSAKKNKHFLYINISTCYYRFQESAAPISHRHKKVWRICALTTLLYVHN